MHQKNLNRYDAHMILQEFKHDVTLKTKELESKAKRIASHQPHHA